MGPRCNIPNTGLDQDKRTLFPAHIKAYSGTAYIAQQHAAVCGDVPTHWRKDLGNRKGG